MSGWKLTQNPDVVIRLSDGALIPRGHRFWDEYEAFLAAGGVPEPSDY